MKNTSLKMSKLAITLVLGAVSLFVFNSCYRGHGTSGSDAGQSTSSLESSNIRVKREFEHSKIRKQLHYQMAQGAVVSRREAWDALSEGAAVSEDQMKLFYTRRIISKTAKASGENQSQSDYWNREHLWPRSFGLKGTSADFDLHNLVPVDRTVNSSRGNKVFGLAHSPHHECEDCRVSSNAWEPPSEVKGDIARVLFYMDVRYDVGQDTEMAQKYTDLSLQEIPNASRGEFGPLSILLSWHCEDDVSEEEKIRQEIVYKYQGNRNLFVDDSDLVEEVYGVDCDAVVLTSSDTLD